MLQYFKKYKNFIKETREFQSEMRDYQLQLINLSNVQNIFLDRILSFLGAEEVERIKNNPKYADPRRLEHFSGRVYSQNGEDFVLAEIFSRIGIANRSFIEFGVENGIENNTLYLLKQGWKGVWIEGNKNYYEDIKKNFAKYIDRGMLFVINEFITRDNIEQLLLSTSKADDEIDLLSIDIDGNDYYVWQAITHIVPRVVVIEYNAKFPPPIKWIIEYNENHKWEGTDYHGASLAALNELGLSKGYELVACDISGANAFFVRKDLVDDQFYRSENISDFYHPARYDLHSYYHHYSGHKPSPNSGRIL